MLSLGIFSATGVKIVDHNGLVHSLAFSRSEKAVGVSLEER